MRMSYLFIQMIGFVGVSFFLMSYQVRSNRLLFALQTLGCLTFCLQFALLGAYSGCLSLLVNITRNIMLTKYNDCGLVRWKGWVVVFSGLCLAIAFLTWSGPASLLPAVGTIAGTAAYWTNNAKSIRIVNLSVACPCALLYDGIIRSWGGILNESITIAAIVISIIRFGWAALDGDKISP